ncbi:unnamed protein product [Closterium sp. NIES-54]
MRGLVSGMTLPGLECLELWLVVDAEEFPLPLESFPNLRSLIIQRAGRMKKLPEGIGSTLQRLRQLAIHQAVELTELTQSLTEIHSLTSIEIHAPWLSALPYGIGALSRLRELNLANCSSLVQLPATLTRLCCLNELRKEKQEFNYYAQVQCKDCRSYSPLLPHSSLALASSLSSVLTFFPSFLFWPFPTLCCPHSCCPVPFFVLSHYQ